MSTSKSVHSPVHHSTVDDHLLARSDAPLVQQGRLIVSGPGEGAMNMAVDAAILEQASVELGPTLRLYGWEQPTLSLGYFQSLAQRTEHDESRLLPVVRRSSGGGALVHDQELTYSLVLPSRNPALTGVGTAHQLYRSVHQAFIRCLSHWGITLHRFGDAPAPVQRVDNGERAKQPAHPEPFLCFQRRTDEDLILHGYKVLGSAQRRGRSGLLQHGGLLVAASPNAPQLPGINELAGVRPSISALIDLLAEELRHACGVNWERGKLSFGEETAAKRLLVEKYSSEEWINKK